MHCRVGIQRGCALFSVPFGVLETMNYKFAPPFDQCVFQLSPITVALDNYDNNKEIKTIVFCPFAYLWDCMIVSRRGHHFNVVKTLRID